MALISSGFVGRRCFIFWIFLAERRGTATLTNKAFRVRWVYLTLWIFKRSVRPMGPLGSPDTITIVLPFRASFSLLPVFSASVNMDSVDSFLVLLSALPMKVVIVFRLQIERLARQWVEVVGILRLDGRS